MADRVNPAQMMEKRGFAGLGAVHYNLTEPALVEAAVARGEGKLGIGGAFLVSTGEFTGRSPKDKHIVRTPSVESAIWSDKNAAMTPDVFETLRADMVAHIAGREMFVQDLVAGADETLRLDVRMVTELAWHALFIRHLLRRREADALGSFAPDWTVIKCPSFRADPARGTAAGPPPSSRCSSTARRS